MTETVNDLKNALDLLVKELYDCINIIIDCFKEVIKVMMDKKRRIMYLAFDHKKARTRKKNIKRLVRELMKIKEREQNEKKG